MSIKLSTAIKDLGRYSIVYATGDFLGKGLAFLLVPVYTRNLSSADYGILSVCMAILSVLPPLLSLGLGSAVTRFYVEFDHDDERRKFLGTVFLSLLTIGLGVTLVFNVVGHRLGSVLFRDIPFDPYLRLTVWASFLSILAVVPVELLRIRENTFGYGVLVYGNNILKVILSVWFVAVMHRGVIGALEGIFWANFIFLWGYLYVMARNMSLGISVAWLPKSLVFGLPLVPHSLFHRVLSVFDRFILERFVSLDEVGAYSLGYQISLVIGVITMALNTAWVPYMMNRYKESDSRTLFSKLATYFVLISAFITLGVMLLGRDVISLVASTDYYRAEDVIVPVAAGYLFLAMYLLPVNYLFLAQRTGRIAAMSGLAAAVNILLNLVFVPRYGIMAAAWATTVAYFVLFVGVFATARRLRIAEYEYRRIGIVLFVVTLVALLDSQLSFAKLTLDFLLRIVLLLSYPLLLYFAGFYNTSERKKLRHLVVRFTKSIENVFT